MTAYANADATTEASQPFIQYNFDRPQMIAPMMELSGLSVPGCYEVCTCDLWPFALWLMTHQNFDEILYDSKK